MAKQPSKRQTATKLAGEIGMDIRTALAWLEGEDVSSASAYALEAAARKLGITRDDTKAA